MSTSFLVSKVLENARQRMALPSFSSSTNVSQSQALIWLGDELQSLQALTRQKLGQDMDLILVASLSTTANQATITLPTNFGEFFDLLWVKSDTVVLPLDVMSKDDVIPAAFDPKEWVVPPKYRIVGNTIEFSPCPNQVYSLKMWHSGLNTISAAGDTIVGRLDWAKWLELALCVVCGQKKRRWSDVAQWEALKKQLEVDMFSRMRRRDQNAVHQVRDVGIYGEYDNWRWTDIF